MNYHAKWAKALLASAMHYEIPRLLSGKNPDAVGPEVPAIRKNRTPYFKLATIPNILHGNFLTI